MPFARLVLAAAVLLPLAAQAQRNGDVSNGLNNQPSSGEVQSREHAAGVAPPLQQQRAATGAVDNIYEDLMKKERADGLTAAPANPAAGVPTPAPSTQPR